MAKEKILVTGPTGTTGRRTVEILRLHGRDVRAIVHKESPVSERLHSLGVEALQSTFSISGFNPASLRRYWLRLLLLSPLAVRHRRGGALRSGCRRGGSQRDREHLPNLRAQRIEKPRGLQPLDRGASA